MLILCISLSMCISKSFHYIYLQGGTLFSNLQHTKVYIGISCNIPYPPGTFGHLCAENCSKVCLFENCHHEFGCPPGSSSVPKPTQSGLKQFLSLSCMYFTVVYNSNFLQLQLLTVTLLCNCRRTTCFHRNIQ